MYCVLQNMQCVMCGTVHQDKIGWTTTENPQKVCLQRWWVFSFIVFYKSFKAFSGFIYERLRQQQYFGLLVLERLKIKRILQYYIEH